MVDAALAAEGPLTREQLRATWTPAGVRTAGPGAGAHPATQASLRGLTVRGPVAGGDHALGAGPTDWLGAAPPASGPGRFDRDAASPSWPAATWPATPRPDERDLAKWAGLPLRDARARARRAIAAR